MIEVIKFGAEWCAPCKAMIPIIESLKKKYDAIIESNVSIMSIDIDENPEMASKYKIKSIPTTIFIKNDEVVEKKSGVLNEAQIEEIIKSLK
jgi:thioredoxin 1